MGKENEGLELTQESLVGIIKTVVSKEYQEHREKTNEENATMQKATLDAFKELLNKNTEEKKKINPGEDPKGGYSCFAEFANDIFKAGPQGQNASPKLVALSKAAGDPTMQEANAEDGGYLLPTEFRNQLLQLAVDKADFISKAMQIPMKTNSIEIPVIEGFDHSAGKVHGNVQMKWLAEKAQKTGSTIEIGRVKLSLNKIAGLMYATDELMEDSPISLEPIFNKVFSDALAFALDGAVLDGTGGGQPLGVFRAGCTIAVGKENNQTKDTIIYKNIVNMFARQYRKNDAVWIVNHDTIPQLMFLQMPVGTGGVPIWIPGGMVNGKPFSTILGSPVIITEHAQTLGDVGDISYIDWNQYLVGKKVGKGAGIQFATSIHLKFDYDQTAFRFVHRIDGQPWMRTAITPKNSAKTLSPFVTLAERA